MKTAGIICEYNPMHIGHERMIRDLHSKGYDTVVCIMSGNFVQRGEPAIADKYTRAAAAVCSGADVVLELPFPWCAGSARYFAESGVYILSALGIKTIAFGSESGDAKLLSATADAADSANPGDASKGTASEYFSMLASELKNKDARLDPNDILAVEYIRASKSICPDMSFEVVKRIGAGYNSTSKNEAVPSATALRALIREGESPVGITESSGKLIEYAVKNGEAPVLFESMGQAIMSHFRLNGEKELSVYAECGGGVSGRLCYAAQKAVNVVEMFELAATKKYTNARLRRAALFALTGTKRDDLLSMPGYTTLLALNSQGRKFLASVRRRSNFTVLTKPARENESRLKDNKNSLRQAELSIKADALYTLAMPKPHPAGEYVRHSPFCLQNSD